MSVPWPGSNGISTVKPASASASARPRIDWGLPVKPCRTERAAAVAGRRNRARHRGDGSGHGSAAYRRGE